MADKYKINGRFVTKKEFDAHCQRRKELYGDTFQDMLDSRQAPMMANSDRMFMEGAFAQSITHGLGPVSANRYIELARKAGINTHGKVFMSQLGKPTNPLAWVSGIEDVRTSCKIQGKGAEQLGLNAVIPDPGPDVPLADDIIQEEMESRFEANPDLAAKCRENPEKALELRADIIQKHGPQK